jgi:hypothetical protein
VLPVRYEHHLHIKVKLSVTDLGGLYGCEVLRIPHYLDSCFTDCGEFVNLTHRPRSTPSEIFFLFLPLVLV